MIKECLKCGITFDAEEVNFALCRKCLISKRVNEDKSEMMMWDYHYRYRSNENTINPIYDKFILSND